MKYIGAIILLLISNCSYSQTVTFNKRIDFGQYAAVLISLETTDSCYYATGQVAYTSGAATTGIFAKFDTLGNELLHTLLPTNMGTYGTWSRTLRTDTDGNLIVTAYLLDSNTIEGGIIKYDPMGNLLWTSLYNNPYTLGGFIRPEGLRVTNDSGYIMVSTVEEPQQAGGDVSILRLDQTRNILWHVTRGSGIMSEKPTRVLIEDSSFLIGYTKNNLTGVQKNYTVRSTIEKIDSTGNTVWIYQSPITDQVYGPYDLLNSKDGGYIAASGWGSEVPINVVSSQAITEAYVYKIDSARNFLWGTKFHSDVLTSAVFSRIIELQDSSLVAFGSVVRAYPPSNPSYGITHGRVVKLSPQGDSLWSRDYEYLTSPGAKNYMADVERTYDGGFLICGEARGTGSGVLQQGWLLKLDEHGCLVPGCHLASGVLPIGTTEQVGLSLYPNPTTDYLNVHYQATKIGEELTFSVVDIQGRVQQTYNTIDMSDKTYIVPVYDLVVGMYILEIRRDGELIASKQFIKQ